MAAKPVPRWATIKQTADYLAVTPRTVANMLSARTLTAYRIGARIVRVDLNEVDAVLTNDTRETA